MPMFLRFSAISFRALSYPPSTENIAAQLRLLFLIISTTEKTSKCFVILPTHTRSFASPIFCDCDSHELNDVTMFTPRKFFSAPLKKFWQNYDKVSTEISRNQKLFMHQRFPYKYFEPYGRHGLTALGLLQFRYRLKREKRPFCLWFQGLKLRSH